MRPASAVGAQIVQMNGKTGGCETFFVPELNAEEGTLKEEELCQCLHAALACAIREMPVGVLVGVLSRPPSRPRRLLGVGTPHHGHTAERRGGATREAPWRSRRRARGRATSGRSVDGATLGKNATKAKEAKKTKDADQAPLSQT